MKQNEQPLALNNWIKIMIYITKILSLFLCFFCSINSIFASDNIYQDYQFSPTYPTQTQSARLIISESFDTKFSNEWMTTKIKSILEINNVYYAVGYVGFKEKTSGKFNILKRKMRKKGLDISELKQKTRNNHKNILVVSNKDSLKEIEIETRDQRFYSNGHGAYDYLYCTEDQPLFSAPLFKNKPFLFHVTAKGQYTLVGEGFDYVKLNIYSPYTDKLLLSQSLLLANYGAFAPDEKTKDSDFYFSWVRGKSKNHPELNLATTQHEGRKHYAKLFIQDFDKNNKLDIIVWHREYASARRDDKTKKGFYLEKERFEWLEEDATSEGLVKKELTVNAGHELLKKQEIWWKDGWPNQNQCKDRKKHLPYMMYIKDDAIGEPMGATMGYGY